MLDAVMKRIRREIKAPLKLVGLDTGESKQRRILVLSQQTEIREIRLDVLIDNVSFDCVPLQFGRRHASQVRNRRIGHKPATESLDAAGRIVFARLQYQNAQLIHGSPSQPSDRGTYRWKDEDRHDPAQLSVFSAQYNIPI
jgi:hypothetical protein